jgi:TorA maturation chaperone TorD
METENFVAHEAARGNIFRLLADYYRMPNRNMLENIHDLADMLSLICPQVVDLAKQLENVYKNGCDVERLKVDFARLFVGPYTLLAPPYGSVYLEGERRVMGDSTLHALAMYREAGVDIASDFSDAPDHIAAELEFMYYLVFKEIEGITGGDPASAMNCIHKQCAFLNRHLGAWVSEFVLKVEENADTEFYKNLAKLTIRFVRKDLEDNLEFTLRGIREILDERAMEPAGNPIPVEGLHIL